MKFKFFLRGFGIGIIFASLVCLVAYQSIDSNKISEEEIIKMAKELGMVEQDNTIEKILSAENNSETEHKAGQKTNELDTNEEKTTVAETVADKTTTENDVSEEDNVVEKSTTEESTTTTEMTLETVTITIKGGTGSYLVCQKLQELGLIESAEEFDKYLIENGYAHRIRVGTHTLTIGMTYKEIADVISDSI